MLATIAIILAVILSVMFYRELRDDEREEAELWDAIHRKLDAHDLCDRCGHYGMGDDW